MVSLSMLDSGLYDPVVFLINDSTLRDMGLVGHYGLYTALATI